MKLQGDESCWGLGFGAGGFGASSSLAGILSVHREILVERTPTKTDPELQKEPRKGYDTSDSRAMLSSTMFRVQDNASTA